jgi:hypothetical protein
MKIKVSKATNRQLDWLVATAQGWLAFDRCWWTTKKNSEKNVRQTTLNYAPTVSWAQGGQIIEREKIGTVPDRKDTWRANNPFACTPNTQYGPTPMVAAMRCYVASKLGDEVEVPDELR